MLIGVPISLGIAIFLTEICPERLKRTIGTAIELLAGIPSIIYGIWGLFVFAPWFQVHVQPFLIDTFANIPVLNQLFAGPPYGIGMLTAGLILAIMVLPFITSITREVFDTVPPVLKEAAYGIGCTRWEVIRRVVIPYTRVGIIGGVMLGLGRALGETMAVTFVIGNAHRSFPSILAPGTTISASIANEFTEATGDLYTASLDRAWPHPVLHHLHRACLRQAHADAASAERGEVSMASIQGNSPLISPASAAIAGDGALDRRGWIWPDLARAHPARAGGERRGRALARGLHRDDTTAR